MTSAPTPSGPLDQSAPDGGAAPAPLGSVVLLVTTPRVVPGQLSWPAWRVLREAALVLTGDLDPLWEEALAEADVIATPAGDADPVERAVHLLSAATAGAGASVVWFAGPEGDDGLAQALTDLLSRRGGRGEALPEIEIVNGSFDAPGARLLDVVAVMDTLRSPGGCPWDAEQTHTSLAPYLLEEAHEAIEALESGDRAHLREELGDVLLQVVFNARVAEEDADEPFSIDDVAGDLVAKLVHRHPHVFGDAEALDAGAVEGAWEELKSAEKGERGVLEGVPVSLPALARAQKSLRRLRRAGLESLVVPALGDATAAALWAAVLVAEDAGTDAEAALRAALGRLASAVDALAADPNVPSRHE